MKKVSVIVDCRGVQFGDVLYHFDSYIIAGDLAVTIDPEGYAVLERIRPSAEFPDCYESAGEGEEITFRFTDVSFVARIPFMTELELLSVIVSQSSEQVAA